MRRRRLPGAEHRASVPHLSCLPCFNQINNNVACPQLAPKHESSLESRRSANTRFYRVRRHLKIKRLELVCRRERAADTQPMHFHPDRRRQAPEVLDDAAPAQNSFVHQGLRLGSGWYSRASARRRDPIHPLGRAIALSGGRRWRLRRPDDGQEPSHPPARAAPPQAGFRITARRRAPRPMEKTASLLAA
jgi:hypothetical protein